MKTWVLLLGCLLALSSQAQTRREVWQWQDANGVTHFSDYPAPGARKIVLNGAPSSSTSAPNAGAEHHCEATRRQALQAKSRTTRLEIWSPGQRRVVLRARCGDQHPDPLGAGSGRSGPSADVPRRQAAAGRELPWSTRSPDVERGVHSVTSVIVDRNGKEKIRSAPVVFHMKQTTVTNPRNQGPAVRPPQPKRGG